MPTLLPIFPDAMVDDGMAQRSELTRRQFLFVGAGAGAALQPVQRRRQPNIIVIVADDLGWGEVDAQEKQEIPTPHLLSLVRNGVRCTNGYVSAPVCSPSRAGLMTGRYQTRFGHEFNALGTQNNEPEIGLPLSEKTIADHLKGQGYVTGMVGKWHLGGAPRFHPLRRGFDEFFGFLHEGHFYVPPPYAGVVSMLHVTSLPEGAPADRVREGDYIFSSELGRTEDLYDAENPLLRGWEPVHESGYLTDALAREAAAFIDRHAAKPFFLHLPFNAPHCPLQAPPRYMEPFQQVADMRRRIFAGMVAALDAAVGTVLAKLREKRLEEDTLIVFLSDHGGNTKELTSSNAPFQGGKGSLLEGGIRVPFFLQWKGRLPAGRIYEHPVSALDILPTALGAAGGRSQPGNLDGVDLLPFLAGGSGTKPPHESLYWRYGENSAVRSGKWKLLRRPAAGGGARFALYDLAADAGETRDVASANPAVAARLQKQMIDYQSQMAEPLWRAKFNRPTNWPLDLIR
jgi:arylsulfatase B